MQTSLTYRTNRDLFSNYYLDEHLPETDAWDAVDDEALKEAYGEIKELWDREKSTAPKRNESQLEEKFLRPMFRKLGIPFEVEEKVKSNNRFPDYGFFDSEEAARKAFERRERDGDFYKDAVAVADAKRWGRPLDTRGEQKHDFENPSYQIHVYLQETPAQWAVLTNGQKWRLYYGPTSHRLDSYYEIDLPTILEKGDLTDFKYFYLFFRHEAFLDDSSGDCFLDDVYEESNVFSQELGQDLQENIYEAIKVLSEGFLKHPDNDLSEEVLVERDLITNSYADLEEARLNLIHDSSLIYLYRLIFVLYAESEGRDLLNTNNEIYEQSYSLNSLKQDVAEELDSANPKYHGWQDKLWSSLDELFKLIDQGSKSRGIPEEYLYIPAYNGGLFRTNPDADDNREARFLAEYEAGDAYLARVIELLTRSTDTNGGGKIFVDYSSLEVRHLGSIYEGLLEYSLNVAYEPLTVEDGEYRTAGEGDEVVVEEDEVYLTTDSGERKATGSYYTPEHVVEYIVDNTLGPLVQDIRKDLVGQSAFGDDLGFAEEFAQRVFDLKVLDPAMGSGHFLTNAVDYLAREIIDAQEKQAKQQGIETVNKDHDINWARRQVVQRCIYGVDLNPLAVELAKVSLWLRTLAAEQPLAFLDHHLKAGNSLIGSDIEKIEELRSEGGGDEQNTSLADFGIARKGTIEQLMRIYTDFIAIENQDLADVKEMESKYDEFERNKLRQRLEALANVYTADDFGLKLPGDAYKQMAVALEDDEEWSHIAEMQWFKDAQIWADDNHYFHWKLEYPEVFYDVEGSERANSGFDVVIGNPPYVNVSQISESQREYLSVAYSETYAGNSDILYYFMQQGLEILREDGFLGLIVARYFAQAQYAADLREYLLSNSRLEKIVDFGNFQAFPGVDVLADILFCVRDSEPSDYDVSVMKLRDDEASQDLVRRALPSEDEDAFSIVDLDVNELSKHPWNLVDKATLQIKRQMEEKGWCLGDHYDVVQSMQTGFNEGLVVDDDTIAEYNLESELLRKLAKTKNVRRYLIKDLGEYVLWTEVQNIDNYPNTKAYLEQYREDLAKRYDIKQRGANWWQISNPRNEELFAKDEPRILTPFMSTSNKFAIDQQQRFNDGGDIRALFEKNTAPASMEYVLAILNSKLGEFYHKNTAKLKRDGYYEYYGNALERFPIFDVDLEDSSSESDHIYQQFELYLEGDLDSAKQLTQEKLELTDEVIHSLLSMSAERMRELREMRHQLNLHLPDYLGSYSEGESLGQLSSYQPPMKVNETRLVDTKSTHPNLRIGEVQVKEEDSKLVVMASARYKPENQDEFETDRWGYTETPLQPALEFVGTSSTNKHLIKEFVEYAVNEEDDGFANFRSTATKTNSLIDRLEALTLPNLNDVEKGLERYIETRRKADNIGSKMTKIDDMVDHVVYTIYGLSERERKKVEETIG